MMRKNKAAYMNYVCNKCFHKLHECTCEYFPPWQLIHVDEGIQEPVRILNEKGYTTTGCCEGHYVSKQGANTGICFNMDYNEIKHGALPEGFKYMNGKSAIIHEYSAKLNKDEFAEEKAKAMSALLEWCKALPKMCYMR